ncbi:MAG: hypothetical protein ACJAZ9_000597 [Neolewinella sp.]|jgi:hypothetical protein
MIFSKGNGAFFHQIHLLLTQSQKFIGCIKGGPVPQFGTSDDLEEAAKLTGSSTHLMNFHPASPGWKIHPMSEPLCL